MRSSFILAGATAALACGSPPPASAPPSPVASVTGEPRLAPPSPAPAPAREEPPAAGPSPDWKFPVMEERSVGGLALRVIERHALPLVQLELVVKTGSASDGDRPGLAAIAAELLKAGGAGKWGARALLDAVESL